MTRLAQDLLVTFSAVTGTTERQARRRGARYFLPALFVDRFANFGGIDPAVFSAQLDGCRSFEDTAWAGYWRAFADAQLDAADAALAAVGGPAARDLLAPRMSDEDVTRLGALLGPAVQIFADRTPENAATLLAEFCRTHPEHEAAARAVDALVKAMVYLFTACWPGWTPQRLAAYRDSQRLFEVLLLALAPAMQVHAERIELEIAGQKVVAYGVFPTGSAAHPTLLITNGLEGTVQEALVPVLPLRHKGLAFVVMEMPGTFQYDTTASLDTERSYAAVLDQLAAHPRVDADRMAMMGISFGAHWSTRAAAGNTRLKAVVSNGGPYHRTFRPTASFGMPEIMVSTMQQTFGAKNPLDLGRKLTALSARDLYAKITIPILVINGDTDTLVSTQDSVDLATTAPHAELKLYPDDDHCAMRHYTEWMTYSTDWVAEKLK